MDSTYILLQHYWWFLVSLLGALLVFLLFVQGGQSLLFTIGKTELQQKMLLNSTGRKWEFTFTTLVTFGGAFFASFPLFYSTSFGGAYWVWMLILACFVLQAVSYEYQSKKGNLLGKKTYQVFLLLNGILGPILLPSKQYKIAGETFFSGAEFVVNKGQLTDVAMPVISTWATPWHGLEAALVFWNVCLGLAVFFLARIQALLYFINNIDDAEIVKRSRKHLVIETALFLVFFLVFLVHLLLADGFAVDPETKEVYMLIKAILLGLVGIVGVIDSRLIGRQNIGRPLILSTLAGLVLGDVRQGVILGASLELISMGFVAIGAAGPPNMQFGSIIATAFAILSGASTEAALTIAVPVAVIGEFLSVIMRMVIAQFSHVADKAIENGQFKKAIHIHLWWSFGFNALVYFIPIFLTVYFGTDLVTNLVAAIPQVITNGLTVAGNLLSALGFAMLLSSMLSKKMFPYFLLGFLIVAYSGLSLIGVTMFAAILAFILDKVLYGKGANA